MFEHKEQSAMMASKARFVCSSAGRRGGKSEHWKRRLVERACEFTLERGQFAYCAPTYNQAKKIAWDDLKKLVPRWMLARPPKETELEIELINGAVIWVVGMDKPQRIEGTYLDGVILDEYGAMKANVWGATLRPCLSTLGRPGWAALIGKPCGRNHWYDRCEKAKDLDDWEHFTWHSSTVLPAEEIAAAKEDLDAMTFKQEFEASFLNFTGRAYYPFDRTIHGADVKYDPSLDLVFCFDFNVEPGIAVVAQEQQHETLGPVTACIGEVHIPRNSTTPAVCRKLAADWRHHENVLRCYGDATGGARGSAKVAGSDWDLIRAVLKPTFGERMFIDVPRANPPERARVNSVNTRLLTADDRPHMLVNVTACPMLVKDFEGVTLLEGGSGELDKKLDSKLTHWSDGLGYYIHRRFPFGAASIKQQEL